jgi:hypothetical protein
MQSSRVVRLVDGQGAPRARPCVRERHAMQRASQREWTSAPAEEFRNSIGTKKKVLTLPNISLHISFAHTVCEPPVRSTPSRMYPPKNTPTAFHLHHTSTLTSHFFPLHDCNFSVPLHPVQQLKPDRFFCKRLPPWCRQQHCLFRGMLTVFDHFFFPQFLIKKAFFLFNSL